MSKSDTAQARSGRPIKPEATIDSFTDGGLYALPTGAVPTEETTFTSLVVLESVVVKLPTLAAEEDFRRYVINEEVMPDFLRRIEVPEQRGRLDEALSKFPDLRPLAELSEDIAHFAVVHKMQHERLQAGGVRVPTTRFGALQITDGSVRAAIFQEWVHGVTLLDMYDAEQRHVKTDYRSSLAGIAQQLSDLLQSPLRNHINWYIRNFVVDGSFSFFTYVDCKPSVMFAAEGNRQNINGLKRRFGVQDGIVRDSFVARMLRKLRIDA